MSETADMTALTEKVRDLQRELAAVRAAPLPLDAAVARAKQAITAAASALPPFDLAGFVNADLPPRIDLSALLRMQPTQLLSALIPDALATHLEAQLRDAYRDLGSKPMTEAQRRKRIGELQDELLQAEIAEEREIRTRELQGFDVERREDASPAVVLASLS